MTIRIAWSWKGSVEHPIGDGEATSAARTALVHGGRPDLDLDVVFVDDETLCEMHGRFLGDRSPTDVIAFDLSGDGGEPLPEGAERGPEAEVYVSVDRALCVASERGTGVDRELSLYVAHGALHLCGFDDHEPEDRRAMRAAEAEVLARLGYPPDAGAHDAS